jgi:hypothetical protein
VKFHVYIPGQPPSLNHSYRIIRVRHRDGTSHQQLGKTKDVETYQTLVSMLVRQACPKDWNPPGQIRIKYWFRMKRHVDTDNTLKALNDAIKIGLGTKIVGTKVVPIWDDKLFLPCVQEVSTRHSDPSVDIEVSYAI